MPHNGLPVAGYKPQTDDKIELVNDNKQLEERVLRQIDDMVKLNDEARGALYDHRWINIARTAIEQGFMALNRSVFQPGRVRLPEDDE
jgi:hypothetical protein